MYFFLLYVCKKMRYLRYCDTRAIFWRPDAICERKNTIPNAIPYDTEYDTISVAGRTRKKYKSRPDAIYSLVSYFQKHDTSTIPTKTSPKNTIPHVSKKMRYRAILRYQLAQRKYDTNKKPAKFFTPPEVTPIVEVTDLVTSRYLC